VGSFGERLRREREMRGISLDEIATATKISTRNLRALEEEKFKQLPGGIFNKGFVRAYAKFLGIDEEQMVAEYVAASQDTDAARDQKLQQDLSKVDFRHDEEEQREISLEPKSQWGTIAVIVLIAAAVFGGYEIYQKRKAERQTQRIESQQVQAPPAQAPTPATTTISSPSTGATNNASAPNITSTSPNTTNSSQPAITLASTPPTNTPKATPPSTTPSLTTAVTTPTTAAAKPASEKPPATNTAAKSDAKATAPEVSSSVAGTAIDVKIHANQSSWISIIADGKTIMSGILSPASEKAVRAKEQVVVVIGNASGVEVTYNGKMLETVSKGQDVRKIKFTPSGFEEGK